MKRSEVVLIIAEHMVEPKSDKVEEAADILLKKLEEVGMLPPVKQNRIEVERMNNWVKYSYYLNDKPALDWTSTGWEKE